MSRECRPAATVSSGSLRSGGAPFLARAALSRRTTSRGDDAAADAAGVEPASRYAATRTARPGRTPSRLMARSSGPHDPQQAPAAIARAAFVVAVGPERETVHPRDEPRRTEQTMIEAD